MVERGVLGALLAQRGFTGPERIIEGNKGFAQSLLRGVDNYIVKPKQKLAQRVSIRRQRVPKVVKRLKPKPRPAASQTTESPSETLHHDP